MQNNNIYNYYIHDDIAMQAYLDFLPYNGSLDWGKFQDDDFLYIGKICDKIMLAHKIAYNKDDIIKHGPFSTSKIQEAEFHLDTVISFAEASMHDIVIGSGEDRFYNYYPEKAEEYLSQYKYQTIKKEM